MMPELDEKREIALEHLEIRMELRFREWQVNQALMAVRYYWYFKDRFSESTNGDGDGEEEPKEQLDSTVLLDETRRVLRLGNRAYRTEKTYLGWIRRFLDFAARSGALRREMLTPGLLREYLTYLAVERKVAAATQQQAFNALLFLFKYVLQTPVEGLTTTIRAMRKTRLP